ncbi:hypothetical protein NADFUDRAFT_50291 [Nadsonia fulvescens var. elongata DSM 6958]|uniref:TPR-like protein n=1 Tax=Nadsonia fulvescens var. elongata DSM 6958 TaxID=857566 RepID=A0A1E3PLR8_9ASCO|nr:hypothetical protein NADFUDRAFT_50291 [Nadsonia fulvescens var. elongata DSM 6958]
MAPSTKALLLEARKALSSGSPQDTIEILEDLFDIDPNNYNGYVFAGKAYKLLQEDEKSRKAYEKATYLKPLNPIAWKGLIELSESIKDVHLNIASYNGLVKCYQAEDAENSSPNEDNKNMIANQLNKSLRIWQTKKENIPVDSQTLFYKEMLPGTNLYDYMNHGFKLPLSTVMVYERLIKLTKTAEEDSIVSAINKNKGRIAISTGDRLKTPSEIKYDVYSESPLPSYYHEIVNYLPDSDDESRRKYESLEFHYLYNLLKVFPSQDTPKTKKSRLELKTKIEDLISNLILFSSDDPLAWKLHFNWADVADLNALDLNEIISYMAKFPVEPLSKAFTAFLGSELSAFIIPKTKLESKEKSSSKNRKESVATIDGVPAEEEKKAESGTSAKVEEHEDDLEDVSDFEDDSFDLSKKWDSADILSTLIEAYNADNNSPLIYRILVSYYVYIKEYENAVELSIKGIDCCKKMQNYELTKLDNSINHLLIHLGTSYIYYQSPKNYDKAITIFDKILQEDRNCVKALIGKGLILIEQRCVPQAKKLLTIVHQDNPQNYQALSELSWCDILLNHFESGRQGLHLCLENIIGADFQSCERRGEIWWRIGQSYRLEPNGDTAEYFNANVKALKETPNFAPAYTSLGLFYAEEAKDDMRATKCFYRAFEISASEIEAAERLATQFADNMEWDSVEVIASRAANADKFHAAPSRESSWPQRALGIVALNAHDYGLAVKHFQSSLRVDPKDSHSWVGLGEAYFNSGRFMAASKALNRAMKLNPANWAAGYMLGNVQREIKDFDAAIKTFESILAKEGDQANVLNSLILTLLDSARNNLNDGFFGHAIDDVLECLKVAQRLSTNTTQDYWKYVGDSCGFFLRVQSEIPRFPLEVIKGLLTPSMQSTVPLNNNSAIFTEVNELDGVTKENIINIDSSQPVTSEMVYSCQLMAFKLSLNSAKNDSLAQASAWFNLGIAEQRVYLLLKDSTKKQYLQAASKCFRRSIQLESNNALFWNSYGIALSELNARVSQHCFIRSLVLNPKQPQTWANLGSMYLLNGDVTLAMQSFSKTQSIDPGFVEAWQGQGIVESVMGNTARSNQLFEHSFVISNGSNEFSKLLYGLSVFEKLQDTTKSISKDILESAILALQKYLRQSPTSELALSIQSSLLERQTDYISAIGHLEKYCEYLEQCYERTGLTKDLVSFAKAKSRLSRLYLGAEEFEKVIQNADFCLNVVSDITDTDEAVKSQLKSIQKCRLSCHLASGLAHYFLDEFDSSIDMFTLALEESHDDQDIVILLSQVLWANGGKDEKDVALDQLYSSVGTKGNSLKITLLLGVIALVDDIEDLADAARIDIANLPLEMREHDRVHETEEILSLLDQRSPEYKQETDPAVRRDIKLQHYQRSSILHPGSYAIWKNLNPAVALKIAQQASEEIATIDLSNEYTRVGDLESSQRAVFFAPWNVQAWDSLASAV